MKPGRVEIAGAGFAGLTVAAALAQRGWSVRVHERGSQLRTTGAGIFMFENGLRVLRAIGAYDDAVRDAHLAVIRETRNAANELVSRVHFTDSERATRVIVRQQLIEAIAAAAERAGVQILLGSEAVAADPEGALILTGGTRCPADLVIAADGVNSKVRDSVGLLKSRRKIGDGAFRTLIPRTEHEATSEDGQRIVEYWSGKRRLLYVPCAPQWVYIAMTTILEDEAAYALPFRHDLWTQSFPHLADVIARIGPDIRWDPFEVIRLKSWSRGRVAVFGDAGHAQAPNLGQGGGCAMMNGLGLAVALEQEKDLATAFSVWESRERPLTEHTQRVSSIYSFVATWPDFWRDFALARAGRSGWLLDQRMRTANHIPTGT